MANCDTREEIDHYCLSLVAVRDIECGWLKDKYGLAWQIVPAIFWDLIKDADSPRSRTRHACSHADAQVRHRHSATRGQRVGLSALMVM